jgi:hypothetical protein
MERSSKFISLSGWAGILSGIYALAGSRFGFRALENLNGLSKHEPSVKQAALFLGMIGLIVLLLSVVTSYILSKRKAEKRNENVWNPVSRRLLAASGIPFLTGGIVVLMLIMKQDYHYIAAACLIFYGLALVAGSQFTFNEIKWLGICEILLGLLAVYFTRHGMILWALGFGVMHIVYGTIMHFKYER